MISHVILRATMSYAVRPAAPGDEQAVFALIEALARYARLSDEVSGGAAALRAHLFGARPVAERCSRSMTPEVLADYRVCRLSFARRG